MTKETVVRLLCGLAGVMLSLAAIAFAVMMAAAADGSYYDGPAWQGGIMSSPLITIGRHLVARCVRGKGRQPLAISIGDYLGDALIATSFVCALDGVWMRDTDATVAAMVLLFGGIVVYSSSCLLARILQKSEG